MLSPWPPPDRSRAHTGERPGDLFDDLRQQQEQRGAARVPAGTCLPKFYEEPVIHRRSSTSQCKLF